MPTIKLEAPASEELLNWQKTMLYAQLQLLGDHAGDHERCACEKKDETGEFCIAKHLTAIAEGYCTETIPMTGDESLKQALSQIRNGATDLRREYLEAMTTGKEPPYSDIANFSREARKELEPYLWQYKLKMVEELHQPLSSYALSSILSTIGKNSHSLNLNGPMFQSVVVSNPIFGKKKEVTMLVDTGSKRTTIPKSLADELGFSFVGEEDVSPVGELLKAKVATAVLSASDVKLSIETIWVIPDEALRDYPLLGWTTLESWGIMPSPQTNLHQDKSNPELAPALFSNVCTGGRCSNKSGGEVMMADLISKFTPSECKHVGAALSSLVKASRDVTDLRINKRLWKDKELHDYHKQVYEGIERASNILDSQMETYCSSGKLAQDPILAEITRQVCSTGICLGEPKKKSKLPICTASQKKARGNCIIKIKERNVEADCRPEGTGSKKCPSAFAVCTASLGCRPGSRKEKVRWEN